MTALQNEWLRLSVNDQGCITHLENLKTGKGNVIADPQPLFRMTLHTGRNIEDMAFGEDQSYQVSVEDGVIRIRVRELKTRMGVAKVAVDMQIALEGDHIRFDAAINNESESTAAELYYPCVGAVNTLDGGRMDLLWPAELGRKILNVGAMLDQIDEPSLKQQITAPYPANLSMSWSMLCSGKQCLYYASYDELHYATNFRARSNGKSGVTLELDKMCFVKPGETWEAPKAVIRLYEGAWHEGADEYAAWAKTWRKPIEAQEWMKKMNGYFLVINKQQYGDEMWPYETLPELYEYAQAHGFDTLGLFGWYHTGHDNLYPDLEVSPTMGGAEGLKKGIKDVQDKGGHVTLYYQGHLIDVNSPFYQEKGKEMEGRTIYNNPYYEFYPKACSSDFGRNFSRRVFSTVCPSCEGWHDMMADRIDWVASFGADGALYDQVGGLPPNPCFNEKHNHLHNKPSLSYTQGRFQMFKRIRERVAAHENFAFMSEHTTDAYAQFLDCCHGIDVFPSSRESMVQDSTAAVLIDSTKTTLPSSGQQRRLDRRGCSFPQLYRYTFPETMCTVRNTQPFIAERMVNYAFAYGFKFELEIRYIIDQNDIRRDAEPEKRKYAKAVADLRREFEDYLLLGTFRADTGILNDDPLMIAMRYVAQDGREAIAVWNDRDVAQPIRFTTPGLKAVRYAGIERRGEGMPEKMNPNEVVIIEMEKK
ncbi:MAG: hypothetical protein E7329_12250 [Clostridiales bacterium]|nr:hypothetical protein [Clostridiales bacterium]